MKKVKIEIKKVRRIGLGFTKIYLRREKRQKWPLEERKQCVHYYLFIHTFAISAPMGLCVYMYSANIYTVYNDIQTRSVTFKCRRWILDSSRGENDDV